MRNWIKIVLFIFVIIQNPLLYPQETLEKSICTVLKIIDGDTIRAKINLGFHLTFEDNFRLAGIDTPELRSKDPEEKSKAYAAKDYMTTRLLDKAIIIHTKKAGKYGRYLATIYCEGKNINLELIEEGHAKIYE